MESGPESWLLIIILYELRGEFNHQDTSFQSSEDLLFALLHKSTY